jgi:hypothetical protein
MNRIALHRLFPATLGAALLVTSAAAPAQNQPNAQDQQVGRAQVRERKGPEVDVRPNQAAQVVVLFPQHLTGSPGQQAQPGGSGDIEIVILESRIPAASQQGGEGQPQQPSNQQPIPTGKEYVFNSRDAVRGLVSYQLEGAGEGRKLMVLARVNGQMVEAKGSPGSEGVTVFTLPLPQQADQAQLAAQQQPPQQPPQDEAARKQYEEQQRQQQEARQRAEQERQQRGPQYAAVIMIHAGVPAGR